MRSPVLGPSCPPLWHPQGGLVGGRKAKWAQPASLWVLPLLGAGGREPFRGEYLHLSHLHRTPGLGPRRVPAAQGSWQHVLAPRQGCILMLTDSEIPLSCSVREAVSKRGIFNACEELSLNGLELQSLLLLHKEKEKVKKEKQVFLSSCRVCRTRAAQGYARQLACVIRALAGTCAHTAGTGTAYGRAGLRFPCTGVAEFSCLR